MRKLRLDPEMLHVESFAPRDEGGGAGGTVHANSFVSDMVPSGCCEPASQHCQETDYHWNTCGNSCIDMCFNTGVAQTCVD
ncbi:MAG TPA: hypothetical protein VFR37_17685 [Longimicrobium sp.]|nr:hypothetical protein [Longimicrobium sp.]